MDKYKTVLAGVFVLAMLLGIETGFSQQAGIDSTRQRPKFSMTPT